MALETTPHPAAPTPAHTALDRAALDTAALDTLAEHGTTARAWSLANFDTPDWHGDTCGCPDDRCIGHHHDEHEPCGCLRALLATGGMA